MMSQFQRQLNATVVFITILSNIIAFLLVYLFISVFHINPWGPIYGPETAEVFGPAFISFFGDTALILADILCMIGFAWVLSQKNRHRAYLLFFTAFIVFDIPVFLSYIINGIPDNLFNASYWLRFVGVILWIAGWITLLVLTNKSNRKVVERESN
jgi:hypothetical protein